MSFSLSSNPVLFLEPLRLHNELLRDLDVRLDHGADAYESAFLRRLPLAWINLGRHKEHATMKPRDTSASVHRPIKRPLCDTSAWEITGAILSVDAMRIAEAMQALGLFQSCSQ